MRTTILTLSALCLCLALARPPPVPTCRTGKLQCCKSVITTLGDVSPELSQLLGSAGVELPDPAFESGLTCDPSMPFDSGCFGVNEVLISQT